ncbi:hypothetical protein P171DRAFT_18941 [Karstenula rhodostoma CBS 690.94]|uniref:Uncharacterized protein n=1 Tax=Karstenula rhodostoma CBS 690.94 TaxID=1392251 RepID=A0A9P4PZL0_9PLEO|nr:hypothetical protein P171DRAFT_18941 [Karstenula rhodostoma CBS 690.94]
MVDNNTPRRRSLRDAPPLSSSFRNLRRASATERRRNRARSASPVRRGARSRDREREARRDLGKRYQHMKGSARTQTTAKPVSSSAARTPGKDTAAGQAIVAKRNSGFQISNLHQDQTVVDNTLRNTVHTARFLEIRTAHTPDPFVASETVSAYLPPPPPPQDMSQNPVLVNAILVESLRMVDYLQRYTATDTHPYSPSEPVARYLEHLRGTYPEALVDGRMERQDQSVADLGGVGVGESVTSPVPDGSGDVGRAGEADADWYTAAWNDGSNDVAKGDV